MTGIKRIIFIGNLVLFFVVANYLILEKEWLLDEGDLVLLELAPADPRSLMQGDYMRLRYAATQNIGGKELPSRGYCIVELDENRVGHFQRFQPAVEPLNKGEVAIKYFAPYRNVKIGAESYFFEVGSAKAYEQAEYGGLRVSDDGSSLLVDLYDKNYQAINP